MPLSITTFESRRCGIVEEIQIKGCTYSLTLEKAFQHEDDVSYKISWHLLKTYSIVINVSKSVQQMISLRFCTDKISFLMVHPHSKIVEIKRIPSDMITEVETSLREASLKMLETLDERLFLEILRGWAKAPSRSFLELAGFGDLPADVLNENVTLTDLRKLALLLDMAVVSYVRSHGSGFDGSYFGHDLQYLEASDGDDEMGFRCFWARLGCLDSFLDKRKVWVFNIYLKDQDGNSLPRQEDEGPEPKSLLTRMEDLADIWGPVYTVPSNAGGVKYYGVSKGVICRVKSKQGTPVGQAVPCHYFSRLSYFRRKASRLLRTADDDLELAGNELLLIGAGFRDNRKCLYTRSAFIEEMKPRMTVLGTKESVWKTDSRGLAFTLSKYLGVTVSGTQKLIPQTSLKQHILDKWTTRPTRSNPTILSQYLGVEISHCTGNARRISIKELMLSEPIRPILDRQSPNWVQTPWGSALNAALRSAKTDDLISVWKEFKLNRSEMAELVCCTLELLDDTGWNEQDEFHSALLFNNEEWAVAMSTKENSWMVALRDTHLTGAYVITNEICIECEVPDHTTSTCENAKSYTVLQTQFATARKPRPFRKADFRLRPFGERFHTAECGSPNITFLTTSSSRDLFKRLRGQGYDECAEVMNPAGFRSTANTVYIRASTRSVHGKHEIKNGMGDLVFRDRTLQSSIGTGHDSVEDNPVGEMEKSTSLNGCRSPVEGMPPMQWGTTQMSPFSLKSAGEQRGTQAPSSASNDSALRPEVTGDSSMRKTPFIDDLENHRPLNGIRQSFWPIQSHDIDDKEHGLIPSDIHGQNVWDFQFRQTKPLTARDSGNQNFTKLKSALTIAKPTCSLAD